MAEVGDIVGKYDMDAIYSDDYACTITDLCNEIIDEAEELSKETVLNLDRVRNKIANSQGSGIVQKLDCTGFHIWEIADKDKHEKHDALKLLKTLYYIEKDDLSKRKRVNITRILLNPCTDNLETMDNGKEFYDIYRSVCEQVEERADYEQVMRSIDCDWKNLVNRISRFIYRPDLISKHDEMCDLLKYVYNRLRTIEQCKNCTDSSQNDGVMRTFLILLIRYQILAVNSSIREEDDRALKLETDYDEKLAKGYLEKAANFGAVVTWEQIDALIEFVKMKWISPDSNLMDRVGDIFFNANIQAYTLGAITNEDLVSEKNKAYRVNSFQYAKETAMWIQQLYSDLNFDKGVPPHVLAGIVQSIYYASKNREKYIISSYGGTKKRTLLAALKDGEEADKMAMLNMESRVANRILIIHGMNPPQKHRFFIWAGLHLLFS